jgi:hypothetical protein
MQAQGTLRQAVVAESLLSVNTWQVYLHSLLKLVNAYSPSVKRLYGFNSCLLCWEKVSFARETKVLGISHTDSRRGDGIKDTSDKINSNVIDHIYDGQFKIYVMPYIKMSLVILERIKAWQNDSITFWSLHQTLYDIQHCFMFTI